MAKFKAGSTHPERAMRIDGVVWTPGEGSGTLKVWGYPTSRPTPRFSQFNAQVRSLAETWAGLAAWKQEGWRAAGRQPSWILRCLWYHWDYGWPVLAVSGEEVFKCTNLWRSLQGMAWAEEVPAPSPPHRHDKVALSLTTAAANETYPLLGRLWLTYNQGGDEERGLYWMGLWGKADNNFPATANNYKQMHFIGSLDVLPDSTYDVTELVRRSKRVVPGGVLTIKAALCQYGKAPMSESEAFIRNAL